MSMSKTMRRKISNRHRVWSALLFAAALSSACASPPKCPGVPDGDVGLLLDIDEQGNVTASRVDKPSGYPALDEAALNASRKWKFSPARKNGVPHSITGYSVVVKFRVKNCASTPAPPAGAQPDG